MFAWRWHCYKVLPLSSTIFSDSLIFLVGLSMIHRASWFLYISDSSSKLQKKLHKDRGKKRRGGGWWCYENCLLGKMHLCKQMETEKRHSPQVKKMAWLRHRNILSLVPCLTTEIRVINTKNSLCDSKTKPKTASTKHSSLHELMNLFGIALGKTLPCLDEIGLFY